MVAIVGALIMGVLAMAAIGFGPIIAVVLNHLFLVSMVVGGIGLLSLVVYGVSRVLEASSRRAEIPASVRSVRAFLKPRTV